jgi:hypothetical protein
MKSAKLDSEYEELQASKDKARDEAKRALLELELKFAEKEKCLERDFMAKLSNVESELFKTSEQSKEACIASVYRQL